MRTTETLTEKQRAESEAGMSDISASVFGWLRVFSGKNLLLLCLLLAVVMSALAVVGSSYQSRAVFYELQQVRGQSNQLEVEWGQLLIEQSTFGLEGRIERKAMEELSMKLPDWSRIIMVRYE